MDGIGWVVALNGCIVWLGIGAFVAWGVSDTAPLRGAYLKRYDYLLIACVWPVYLILEGLDEWRSNRDE